ncbi:MAG TPA: hypothetical protein VFC39_18560, partial [Acidobacteriaceae bacterium]|nr:hypothetical protein [Acidobacteriaceae bacterium]
RRAVPRRPGIRPACPAKGRHDRRGDQSAVAIMSTQKGVAWTLVHARTTLLKPAAKANSDYFRSIGDLLSNFIPAEVVDATNPKRQRGSQLITSLALRVSMECATFYRGQYSQEAQSITVWPSC